MSLLNIISDYYANDRQLNKAISLQLQVMKYYGEIGNEKPSLSLAIHYEKKALDYLNSQKQIVKSIILFEEEINILKQLGYTEASYYKDLINLVLAYDQLGLINKIDDLRETVCDSSKISIYNFQSIICSSRQDYLKADYYIDCSFELIKKIIPSRFDTHFVVEKLKDIITYYNSRDYKKAYKSALLLDSISTHSIDCTIDEKIFSKHILANLYTRSQQWNKADSVLASIDVNTISSDKTKLSHFSRTGDYYFGIGEFEKSLDYYHKCIQLCKDEDSKFVYYLNIVNIYNNLKKYKNALSILNNLKYIAEKQGYLTYSAYFRELGHTYSHLCDYKNSITCLENAYKYCPEDFIRIRVEVLNDLCHEYIEVGDEKCLKECCIKGFELCDSLGIDAYKCSFLVVYSDLVLDEKEKMNYLMKAWEIHKAHRSHITAGDVLRKLFYHSLNNKILRDSIMSDYEELIGPNNNVYYEMKIFHLLLNSDSATINDITLLQNDYAVFQKNEIIKNFAFLDDIQKQLYYYGQPRFSWDMIPPNYSNVETYYNMQLFKKGLLFLDMTDSVNIKQTEQTFLEISNSMQENDIAVEFYCHNREPYNYYAYCMRKGWTVPKYIELGDEYSVKQIFNKNNNEINFLNFYKEIWSTVLDSLDAKPGDNIYFSPDGYLSLLPIEYSLIDNGNFLSEVYNVYRCTSTKTCCNNHNYEYQSAALFGGLLYDNSLSKYKKNDSSESYSIERFCNIAVDCLNDNIVTRAKYDYLPFTKIEIDSIEEIIKDKGYKVSKYCAEQGNEQSFRRISGNSPDILHLATHGFYVKPLDLEYSKLCEIREQGVHIPNEVLETINNSMNRSGLLLSRKTSQNSDTVLINRYNDGVVSALDISTLDLSNTKLAILSACDTGIGDLSSDGIVGIQRGFKKAGVKSIMMSLWHVDDQATFLLMTEFYKKLSEGSSPRIALKEAQRYLRNYVVNGEKIFEAPRYWAAFIILD